VVVAAAAADPAADREGVAVGDLEDRVVALVVVVLVVGAMVGVAVAAAAAVRDLVLIMAGTLGTTGCR